MCHQPCGPSISSNFHQTTRSFARTQNNCETDMDPLERRLGMGITEDAEKVNGRAAMMGIISAFFIELFSGKSIIHLFGG